MSSGQGHSPVRAKVETVLLRFTVNVDSGSPTITSDPHGVTDTIADTGTGVYTVTLADSWYAGSVVASHSAGLGAASGTFASPSTLVVRYADSGSAADEDGDITVLAAMERNDG